MDEQVDMNVLIPYALGVICGTLIMFTGILFVARIVK